MAIFFALFFIILGIGAANAHNGINTTQCHSCLENNFELCDNKSTIQNCTSPTTESCFSAAGRYKFKNGSTVVLAVVSRGCIACPNVTEGCKGFRVFFDSRDDWSLQDCNMVCCKGDQCNNQTVSLKPTETTPTATSTMSDEPTATSAMSDEPTNAGHLSHYSPTTAVLSFATIIAVFFFSFNLAKI